MEHLDHVDASLSYLAESAEKPVYYLHRPPEGTPRRTSQFTKHTLPIHNGRKLVEKLSLDEEGFTLARRATATSDFYDADEVRRVYYPEVEQLVRDETGAVRVLAFDHNVRCATLAERGEKGVQMPVKSAHNDYTEKSGPQRVRDLLPAEAEELLKSRFAVINVWRPISGPVRATPLAVCDARSIDKRNLVPTDLVYRDRTGEVYSVTFSPDHRWFYFPDMEADEAMLIKCYDSTHEGRARFTAHTAFDDPTTPADAPARESIEVRTLAFFA
ncbi:MAG: CmcJ/NvfI family oxidoreductase [Myxococcota bacterium]